MDDGAGGKAARPEPDAALWRGVELVAPLDVLVDDLEPVMLATLPDGIIGAVDDIGVVECAERNGDDVREVATAVVHGRAALGTEMVGRLLPAVGSPGPLLRFAFDGDTLFRPARLGG